MVFRTEMAAKEALISEQSSADHRLLSFKSSDTVLYANALVVCTGFSLTCLQLHCMICSLVKKLNRSNFMKLWSRKYFSADLCAEQSTAENQLRITSKAVYFDWEPYFAQQVFVLSSSMKLALGTFVTRMYNSRLPSF